MSKELWRNKTELLSFCFNRIVLLKTLGQLGWQIFILLPFKKFPLSSAEIEGKYVPPWAGVWTECVSPIHMLAPLPTRDGLWRRGPWERVGVRWAVRLRPCHGISVCKRHQRTGSDSAGRIGCVSSRQWGLPGSWTSSLRTVRSERLVYWAAQPWHFVMAAQAGQGRHTGKFVIKYASFSEFSYLALLSA